MKIETFKDKEDQENTFDKIIDLFRNNDCQGFEIEIANLHSRERKNFLLYVFKNKEVLPEMNLDIMVRLTLDYFDIN